jgi:hypothetical protein
LFKVDSPSQMNARYGFICEGSQNNVHMSASNRFQADFPNNPFWSWAVKG